MIESLSNNLIKHAASLKQKKYRDINGEFLAEGMRLVLDICLAAPADIVNVFATESALKEFVRLGFSGELSGLASDAIISVSPGVIKKISDTDTPQEIVAVVKKRPEKISGDYVLFLDRIRDPGNLGTIIRTAAAAGYSLILNNCADIYSQKAVRSCMGGIMAVEIKHGAHDELATLKQRGFKVIAADLSGENLFCSEKHYPVCAIIGSEADGISPEVKALCDYAVTIPMRRTESLNAAVSAAIIMYFYQTNF